MTYPDTISHQHRKNRKPANRFLDVEAVVDDDEEEEDEDEDYADVRDFIAEGAEVGPTDDSTHRNLTRNLRREEEPNIEEILAGIKARHKRQARYNAESDQVPQRLLMPGVDDPSLWQVRVKAGRERNITVSIFRKVFEHKHRGSEIDVSSVFYRDSLPGLIYVEARTSSAVHDAVNGIVGVYISRGVQLVPIEEMAPLLRIKKKEINLTPGMWVRLKRGKYTGDLAQVVEVDQLTSGVVGVKFIPRIDLRRAGIAARTARVSAARSAPHNGFSTTMTSSACTAAPTYAQALAACSTLTTTSFTTASA